MLMVKRKALTANTATDFSFADNPGVPLMQPLVKNFTDGCIYVCFGAFDVGKASCVPSGCAAMVPLMRGYGTGAMVLYVKAETAGDVEVVLGEKIASMTSAVQFADVVRQIEDEKGTYPKLLTITAGEGTTLAVTRNDTELVSGTNIYRFDVLSIAATASVGNVKVTMNGTEITLDENNEAEYVVPTGYVFDLTSEATE